ncbi:MAG: hypothetical protein E7641_03855 [Ruminococcaceae bacterium]|nr:hypothetical protein [Oscillospiraceae bacterium]
MKAYIFQPPYSRDTSLSEEYFNYKLDLLDKCREDADIIVLPEYSDVPCATSTLEETLYYHDKYIDILLERCSETAKRCSAILCVNALSLEESGYRNTTYIYGRDGALLGKYFKKHLPPLELETLALDSDYTFEPSSPYILEIEGLRYAFLTCYDFYFYEAFPNIAKQDVDIIVGCSLQRSDTHSAIEIMCRFLAYNTNAYVLRSSVSFAEDSEICGASMAVDPFGNVLENMKGRFGMFCVEFDPRKKHLKPAGFGNPDAPHHKYIEYGRKPWQYRNGGASVVRFDENMPYPRLCAHRGFSTVAPENTLPALGAAVALGAEEIEFDVWSTSDRVLVSCHDSTLDRVSNGTGKIYDHTYEELLALDFGAKHDERFGGLKITTFEEILRKFSGRVIMNIHVKIWDRKKDDLMIPEIVSLVRKYDAEKHCYFMTTNDEVIRYLKSYAPDIPCCVGWDGNKDKMSMVDRAVALGAYKIQLFKPYFDENTVKAAHEHGILCNVFWADDPDEARKYLEMGIDTILTNDFLAIKNATENTIKKIKEKRK